MKILALTRFLQKPMPSIVFDPFISAVTEIAGCGIDIAGKIFSEP